MRDSATRPEATPAKVDVSIALGGAVVAYVLPSAMLTGSGAVPLHESTSCCALSAEGICALFCRWII